MPIELMAFMTSSSNAVALADDRPLQDLVPDLIVVCSSLSNTACRQKSGSRHHFAF